MTTANIFAVCSWHPKAPVSCRNREFSTESLGSNRLSYIGNSDKKKDAMLLSMKLHIQYLRSLEESERVRKACLTYMQNWYRQFLSGATGHCCGVAGAGCTTSGSPGGAPPALEVCLDEADVWMESCKMGSEGASAAQGFMHQALRQGNV